MTERAAAALVLNLDEYEKGIRASFFRSKAIEKYKQSYCSELKKPREPSYPHDAPKDSKQVLLFTLKKVNFFARLRSEFNDREFKALCRMMEEGGTPFEGGRTVRKYMS